MAATDFSPFDGCIDILASMRTLRITLFALFGLAMCLLALRAILLAMNVVQFYDPISPVWRLSWAAMSVVFGLLAVGCWRQVAKVRKKRPTS
jgi:hypothetical protein